MRGRLGRRQLDVLRAAESGRASTGHAGRGRMLVYGASEVYESDVLDSLLDRGLVDLVDDGKLVNGHKVVLTEQGRKAMTDLRGSA